MPDWLDPRTVTITRLLREAGYATGHFGKWHLGGGTNAPAPGDYGIDEHRTVNSNGPSLGNEAKEPFFRARSTAMIVDEAIGFIRAHRDRPFYLNVWTLLPHAQLKPTPEQLEVYRSLEPRADHPALGGWMQQYLGAAKNLRSQMQVFCASLTDLDTQIGRLLRALDELDLAKDTIVFFSSDNGPEDYRIANAANAGVGSPGPLRARKRSMYEGGIRTFGLVRWPGRVAAGRVDESSVIGGVDWLPTICALAGVPVPDSVQPDGEDVSDIWLGQPRPRRKPLHWEWLFPVQGAEYRPPMLAIRDGDWKLFVQHDGSGAELYNIPADIAERHNVASAHPTLVKELTDRALAWRDTLPPSQARQQAAAGGQPVAAARKKASGQRAAPPAPPRKPNVLFIAADDMRPQLGCYGDATVRSPHLDRLASQGMVFQRAYCQQALCSPSRISLLTGRHIWTTRISQIGPFLRETMPEVVTLPQHFKNQGYFTRSLGKIYHVGIDDPASWSVPPWHSKKPRYGPEGSAMVARRVADLRAAGQAIPQKGENAPFYGGPAFEAPELADDDLLDGDTVREALEAMRALAANPQQPFFLAVGFSNPHVPWVAPKRYWDLYRTDDMPLPQNRYAPRDAPAFAATTGADFYWYGNVPKDRVIPPAFGRQCLHGYLAAISYVDAGVGRLLAELDRLGLRQDTVVVFWGDHGYYMGEHNWWGGKHNNYEGATRAPLIVSAPGMKAAGRKTAAVVEFVDIYPSLVELCGLPGPSDAAGLEGSSFALLLDNPDLPRDKAAFSEYPKGGNHGIAMRTDRYRYVEWQNRSGALVARELYDHQADPDENQNAAGDPANAALIERLGQRLRTRTSLRRGGPRKACVRGVAPFRLAR